MTKDSFAQTYSADGYLIVDAQKLSEAELVNIAYQNVKVGTQLVLKNVSQIERKVLERTAIAGKGLVLFDLR